MYSPIFAKIKISENYDIETNSFKYFINEKTISSQNKVLINDIYGNTVDVEKFKLQLTEKNLKDQELNFTIKIKMNLLLKMELWI